MMHDSTSWSIVRITYAGYNFININFNLPSLNEGEASSPRTVEKTKKHVRWPPEADCDLRATAQARVSTQVKVSRSCWKRTFKQGRNWRCNSIRALSRRKPSLWLNHFVTDKISICLQQSALVQRCYKRERACNVEKCKAMQKSEWIRWPRKE